MTRSSDAVDKKRHTETGMIHDRQGVHAIFKGDPHRYGSVGGHTWVEKCAGGDVYIKPALSEEDD